MNFFKKYKKLSIFLAILVFITFYEVIPEIRGDKVFLPTRLLYSHRELADKIIVKTYILTDEQVVDLYLYPQKEPVLLKNKDFNWWNADGTPPPHPNLVFRIQNRSGVTTGTIQYQIDDECIGKFDVPGLGIVGGNNSNFQNFVIPIGDIIVGRGKDPEGYPEITYKWRKLYACWK